ncbi:hypothetical protein AAHA92_15302 [Salvia divinorum]|uniref:Endonuclease/exonuclease/phosphatase domain-containing protein n=1 Tax=Salvia divinorum TaxID=28513 RepID=A0ABD1HEB7_SALDI
MIVTTWNVRGMQRPRRQPVVVDFIKSNRVDVMGLIETKMKEAMVKSFMAKNFPTWRFEYNIGGKQTCRLLLLWNPQQAEVDICKVEEQAIHAKIRCTRTRNNFNFSLVYGLHSPGARLPLWESMAVFSVQGEPYLVSGDFNAVLAADERKRGKKPENREMDGPCRLQ